MLINAWHKTNKTHLEKVINDMKKFGAPIIRYVETAHGDCAIEGCHRLEAASILEISPVFVEVDLDDEIKDHGIYDCEGETLTVLDIVEMIGTPTGMVHEFQI